jgi:hypothetical protein
MSPWAGDTRVLDVQPNEERILSYAIDLGMEVDPKVGAGTQKIVSTTTKVTEEKSYRIVNRGTTDRTLLIEHPNRTSQQFKLVGTEKPVEDTPEFYRFQISVKADGKQTFTVKEEKEIGYSLTLTNSPDDQIRLFINLSEASPALKQRLTDALALKAKWDGVQRDSTQIAADLNVLQLDQERIRKNLRETPKEAEVYTTYLKKLSDQEKEIDGLTAKQKKIVAEEFTARKKYEDYLANISD